VFHRPFGDEFNCSQAAVLGTLLWCWENGTVLADCEPNYSEILDVFDYYDKNITLPHIDCDVYESMLVAMDYNVTEFHKNHVVENLTDRIFEEIDEVCKKYPNEYLY